MKKHFLLSLMAMLLPLMSWADSPFKISFTGFEEEKEVSFLYNGDQTEYVKGLIKVTYTNTQGKEKELGLGDYTVTFAKDNENVVKNVGEYTVTVVGNDPYDGYEQTSTTIKVTPKPLESIVLKDGYKTYGEKDGELDLGRFVETINGLIETSTDKDYKVEFANALLCMQLTREEGFKGENAGDEARITIGGKAESASNYSYTPTGTTSIVPMTIYPKLLTLTFAEKKYTGEKVDLQSLGTEYDLTSQLEGQDNVTVEFTYQKDAEVKNVDTYLLTATLGGTAVKNYTLSEQKSETPVHTTSVSYKINRAELTVVAKDDQTWASTYGDVLPEDLDLTDQFNITGMLGDDEDLEASDLGLSMRITAENGEVKNAGAYEVQPYYTEGEEANLITNLDEALPNYSIKYDEVQEYTINKQNLDAASLTIAISETAADEEGNPIYIGKDFTEETVAITVKLDEDIFASDNYTIESVEKVNPTAEEKARNAGESFKVTIKGKGTNYDGTTESDEFTIVKAPLYISLTKNLDPEDPNVIELGTAEGENGEQTPVYGLGKVYDGNGDDIDLTKYFEIGYVGEDKDIFTLKKNSRKTTTSLPRKDAGAYYISLFADGKVVSKADYKSVDIAKGHKNYIINYDIDDIDYTIKQKQLSYWIGNGEKSYDGRTADLSKVKVEAGELVDGESISPAFELAIVNDEGEIQTGVKYAGTYDLAVSNLETVQNAMSNYELVLDDEKNVATYTINPAILQITVLDQTVSYPATEEDVVTTISGNVAWNAESTDGKYVSIKVQDGAFRIESDRNTILNVLGKNLKVSDDVDYLKVGEYENALTLSVSMAEINNSLQNYAVNDESLKFGTIFVDGGDEIILNVIAEEANAAAQEGAEEGTEPQLEPTVSELLKAYNDTEVKKVIIKNLKNVRYESSMTAERWHSLVLPFDIKVRDLSSALGYAIVNVPDDTNDAAGDFHFKLTMGTVLANTYMLVKIDEGINWGEIEGDEEESEKVLEFKNVKINYNDEPKTDAATNKFVPVYELTSIYNSNQYVVDYTTGKWVYPNATRGLKVYPLNGYLEAPASAQNIRIFVEDIDGTVTEISEVSSDAINANNAEGWYTINGVKLNAEPTEKGIYINNGKKVVIK